MPGVKSRGNGAQDFKSSLPAESLRVHLVPLAMSCDSMCKCQPGKLITNSVFMLFIGLGVGDSSRQPLPGRYQNSRLPEGKQVHIIKHIVCTKS